MERQIKSTPFLKACLLSFCKYPLSSESICRCSMSTPSTPICAVLSITVSIETLGSRKCQYEYDEIPNLILLAFSSEEGCKSVVAQPAPAEARAPKAVVEPINWRRDNDWDVFFMPGQYCKASFECPAPAKSRRLDVTGAAKLISRRFWHADNRYVHTF